MAGTNANAIPILPYRLVASTMAGIAEVRRMLEESANTELQGCPCNIDASGFIAERTVINTGTQLIAGFTVEAAHNLTTAGVGKALTYGSVQLQTGAQNIPIGAPLSDGTLGLYAANDETEFIGVVDTAHSLLQTDIGSIFGLTKGSNNFWFVDTTITSTGSGACVVVTSLIDAVGTAGGRVGFKVLKARQQLYQ